MPFFDVHSHHIASNTLTNVLLGVEELPETGGAYSVGFHPAYSSKFDISLLQHAASAENVWAIGECGLDSLVKTADFTRQKQLFSAHLAVAEELGKPVIIHCVKQYQELITLKKKQQPSIPLIVHGFAKNQKIADELLDNGFYLSFGANLLIENHPISSVFKTVPLDRLFLETDNSGLSISVIYEKAAALRTLLVADLHQAIRENKRKVFGV